MNDDEAVQLIEISRVVRARLEAEGALPSQRASFRGRDEQLAVIAADEEAVWLEAKRAELISIEPEEAYHAVQAYWRRHPPPNLVRALDPSIDGAIAALLGMGRRSDLIAYLRSGQPISPEVAELLAVMLEEGVNGRRLIETQTGPGRPEKSPAEVREFARSVRAAYDARRDVGVIEKVAKIDTAAEFKISLSTLKTMLRHGRSPDQALSDARARYRRGK